MGSLPNERITPSKLFAVTGVDYVDHYYTRQQGARKKDRQVLHRIIRVFRNKSRPFGSGQ